MDDLWFYVLLLAAEVLGTIGGFGSSLFVMPLAGHFMAFEQALGITALFHVFSNTVKILLFRIGSDKSLVLRLGVPAVVGVVIGALLTGVLGGVWLRVTLGVVLVLIAIWMLVMPDVVIRPTTRNAVVGGGVSGFLAGLVGTGGAVRGVVLAAFGLEKAAFVATSAWIDLGVDLGRAVIYGGQGYFNSTVLVYLPALAILSILGTWIGKKALAYIPERQFKRIVLILVLVVGLQTLWAAWFT
ncbi:MAG: sulfite exporter TauE/SafE family protein [Flavobacteriales bacterium]|jgi:uncharacterized protein|nr:sulfite exporter TauE/SafE family protein [Flavobacteriales bacterium]